MIVKTYYTDKYYCHICGKSVISEVRCHIESITEGVELTAEIGITVHCKECGGEIRNKYQRIEI